MSLASAFNSFKDYIALHYGKNPGRMLIHTGIIGWVLSSMAQVAAIVINDKIPKEQKMFLIPQEMADACVNIASFYLITQTFKSVAGKLVKTGKWIPARVKNFLTNNKLADKIGKKDFDIAALKNLPEKIAAEHKAFGEGIDVLATTTGSILSCNIVTPIIRNEIAANRQKSGIARMNTASGKKDLQTPAEKNGRMNAFQSMAYNKFSNPSLKI